jgi:hypothetical protein
MLRVLAVALAVAVLAGSPAIAQHRGGGCITVGIAVACVAGAGLVLG